MLHAHFHQQLDSNSIQTVRQGLEAHHFGQIFTAGCGWFARVWHGDEQTHPEFITSFATLEKYAAARNAGSAAQIFEVFFLRIGWTDAHQLIDFAAAAAAAFRLARL